MQQGRAYGVDEKVSFSCSCVKKHQQTLTKVIRFNSIPTFFSSAVEINVLQEVGYVKITHFVKIIHYVITHYVKLRHL